MSDMTDKFTGFPSLKPAVITKVNIGDINDLGSLVFTSRGRVANEKKLLTNTM